MRQMPRGEALDWQNDLPDDLVIRIDPDDFGEVVGNLLDNARKWATMRVLVRSERIGGTATISVLDDGPGFAAGPPDPHSDRGVSRTPGSGSSGLGLGIVHDILTEYGVALRVEARDGLCAVSFALPTGYSKDDLARPSAAVAGAMTEARPGAVPGVA
jgi:signal transduction histidine kinase